MRIAFLVAVPLLLLGACGEEPGVTTDSPSSADSTPPDTAGAEGTPPTEAASSGQDEAGQEAAAEPNDEYAAGALSAYRDYLAALAAEDPAAACEVHAPEFTIDWRDRGIEDGTAERGAPCVDFVDEVWASTPWDESTPELEVTRSSPERVELVAAFDEAQSVTMVYHRAAWRIRSSEPRTEPTDETRRWVEGWCDLDVGMSPDEKAAVMGEPSGEYTINDGGEPQVFWTDHQYLFTAYLEGDRAASLVGDYDLLIGADRARLGCPELR